VKPLRLGLGTAQFGLDYGISNAAGKIPPEEVQRILAEAHRAGIRLLDTASLYGDSEAAIGRCLPPANEFRIVTKTPKFSGRFGAPEAILLQETFAASLRKLGVPRVYALLVHDADDLLGGGGDRFMDALLALKADGLVTKVGASVYTPTQVDALLSRRRIDVIQIPFNVLDQRLLRGGQLAALQSAEVEVHARSIFLQGSLLMEPARLPEFLSPARPLLLRFGAAVAACGLAPLQAALAFVLERPEITHGVVGVCDQAQLLEILNAVETLPSENKRPDWSQFHCDQESVVNPALWPTIRNPGRAPATT
jgi:aryl-alcohol dehydrogenase-like predicted oxidoreductase